MEVHHHAHPTASSGTTKKWTHYFWEFLMLFLAVFCGFLAEYQLEHAIEKQRAKEYAVSLHRDITADTVSFNRAVNQLNICVNNIDRLMQLLGNQNDLEKNTTDIYRLSIYAFAFPQAKPNESTLQQMLNSGSLRYFRNNKLIDSVKEYNNEIQFFNNFNEDVGDFNIEFRKIQARILEVNYLIEAISQVNFDLRDANFDTLQFSRPVQLILKDAALIKEYANWCALKKFYMANTASKLNNVKRRGEAALRMLKEEYHFQ
jgi:hypothetical protein